jgi:hypothetical protein
MNKTKKSNNISKESKSKEKQPKEGSEKAAERARKRRKEKEQKPKKRKWQAKRNKSREQVKSVGGCKVKQSVTTNLENYKCGGRSSAYMKTVRVFNIEYLSSNREW